ncbi:Crp/Fnr family transcriptional regulator [Pseudochryseolinea flava]|uniref:Crp/Fnr family transcriptional regulator n=1 Tax=Pseudochryseolinea flava TaxID=2059302 RepID=A0A364YAL7_9BACT|nr:Crp/Fnr family transcriptional regulator [Pseudochryseolinea flava]RAW03359.1 Crp/Fnr family transcriptional regulator [Pseudochryseolinea flava]
MQPWQEKLLRIFGSNTPLPADAQQALLDHWKHPVKLKRHQFLIEKDQTETNLFYIIEGSVRIYFPHNDEEICVGFGYDNSLICSYPSFIRNQPSTYYIQALSATSLMSIRKVDFYDLFSSFRKIETAWRELQEEALMGKIERETEMLTFTPEERYQRLIQRSPKVFQIIPRKYIASYLRMSPETLSRIRPEKS